MTAPTYHEISLDTLSEGILLDRALSVFLPANNRYVQVAPALLPLEARVLRVIKKYGTAWSDEPPFNQRYPLFQQTEEQLRSLLSDSEMAPFEKQIKIQKTLLWVWRELALLSAAPNFNLVTVLMVHVLSSPKPETLSYFSERSLDITQHSLKVASVAAFILLSSSYSNKEFLASIMNAAFCARLGVFSIESLPQEVVDYLVGKSSSIAGELKKILDTHCADIFENDQIKQVPGLMLSQGSDAQVIRSLCGNQLAVTYVLKVCDYSAKVVRQPSSVSVMDTELACKLKYFLDQEKKLEAAA